VPAQSYPALAKLVHEDRCESVNSVRRRLHNNLASTASDSATGSGLDAADSPDINNSDIKFLTYPLR